MFKPSVADAVPVAVHAPACCNWMHSIVIIGNGMAASMRLMKPVLSNPVRNRPRRTLHGLQVGGRRGGPHGISHDIDHRRNGGVAAAARYLVDISIADSRKETEQAFPRLRAQNRVNNVLTRVHSLAINSAKKNVLLRMIGPP